uniref:Hedgehog protein Hint domain-containing protein n=1 Tax=Acrobeloides nanus TaxID=290746 RepID=A0A914DST0_9BILA
MNVYSLRVFESTTDETQFFVDYTIFNELFIDAFEEQYPDAILFETEREFHVKIESDDEPFKMYQFKFGSTKSYDGKGKTSVNVRQIVQIDIITEMGIFAPETENGDIVVNDIIASCYTDVKKESLVKTIRNVHSFIKRITRWFFDENTDEKVKISHGIFNIAMIIIEEIIPMGILATSEMF